MFCRISEDRYLFGYTEELTSENSQDLVKFLTSEIEYLHPKCFYCLTEKGKEMKMAERVVYSNDILQKKQNCNISK